MRVHLRHFASVVAASLGCLVQALPSLPAAAGTGRWTAIGPDGANVVALAIDPHKPATVFAGTVGSGVLKSVDSGANWGAANGALPTVNVLALAIDSSTPSALFAGTDTGVFKSTDGGQSWVPANAGLVGTPQITVNALAIDSVSPATLYAATSAGVFRTSDGAAHWTSINLGLAGLTARTIAIDPTSPSTIYIGVDDNVEYIRNGVFKSTDGGTSWARIYTTAVPFMDTEGYSVAAIAIDPQLPSRLYLALYGGGLLRSADGGGSWAHLQQTESSALAIDPASPATLYAGTISGAVLRGTEAGDRWAAVTSRPLGEAASINVLATSASAPATIYAGARTGIFRSRDRGQTWVRLTLGVKDVTVYRLAVDPAAPSTIYAGVGSAIMTTTDGGVSWHDSDLGSGRWINSIVIDPAYPSTLYAGMGSAPVVYKSIDAGAHWAPAANGLRDFGDVQALAIAPSRPSTLYVGVAFAGVYKSSDGGSSWTKVNNGLTAVGIYTSALAVDPTSADIVYVATPPTGRPDTDAKIFKSTNGAAQWRQLPIALPKGVVITSLVVDRATPSSIYATYYEDGDPLGGGILKSTDDGETWTTSQGGLPSALVRVLAIDPGSPSTIYAATARGVFRTTDGTVSWMSLNAGLPSLEVSDISIDRTGSLLRAATAAGLFEYQVANEDNFTGMWWNDSTATPTTIGPGFTGAWFDPTQSGHGLFVEVLDGNRFLAWWFTFNPGGTERAWFGGVGTYGGNTATIVEVFRTTGGRWIPNFEPSRILNNPWGTLTFTFADCNHGKVDFNSVAGYGTGSMNLTRLTKPSGVVCP